METFTEKREVRRTVSGTSRAGRREPSDVHSRSALPCDGCLLTKCLDHLGRTPAVLRVVQSAKRVAFDPNAVLYRESQSGAHLYVVHSGMVKLMQYPRFGNARIVRLLHRGDVAGFETMLNRPYHHTAITLTAATMCAIPRHVVTGLLNLDSGDHPLRRVMMACWGDHLDTADQWLCGFATGPAEARVARLILYLVGMDSPERTGEVRLLCRDDMASILGLAYESVCREISRLRSVGALRQVGPSRYAYDAALLEQLATALQH